MSSVLIQHACGPAERLLRITQPVHAAYCEHHGIVYRPSFTVDARSWWRKHLETLTALNAGHDGDVVVMLDGSDTLIVGEEHLASALAPGFDLGGVRNRRGEVNSGALWWRNSAAVREFIKRMIQAGDIGTSGQDHERLHASLPGGLKVQTLNRRWNDYGMAAGVADGPMQIRAWHNEMLAAKQFEIGRAIHATQ